MATRLPGTLKFKPKPGKTKAAAPGGGGSGGVQAPTSTISQSSTTAGVKSATPTSSMPPPASVPRRPSVSQASTLVPSPAMSSQPLDSQATLVEPGPSALSTDSLAAPEKRPGPEDAGPSTPPMTQTTLSSQSSTLVGGSSHEAPAGKVPARARASSPALSTTSMTSARSTTSSRAPYPRPGGGKALLVAAAQSREDPLDLPARVHRGGSRARSRAASATPSRASEAPPDPPNGAVPEEPSTAIEGTQPSSTPTGTSDAGANGILVPSTPVPEPDGGPPAFAAAPVPSLQEPAVTNFGPPAFSTAPTLPPVTESSSGAGNASKNGGGATDAVAGATGEKRKREGPRKDAVPPVGGAEAAEGADEDGEAPSQVGKTAQPRKRVRRAKETWANRGVYRTEVVIREPRNGEAAASVAGDEDQDEENSREMSVTPAPSAIASSMSRAKRSNKRRRSPRITIARANLEYAEPGDMIGDEVDETSATMLELVTTRAAEGRVSTRGRNLDRIVRERTRTTAEAGRLGSDDKWRARQPLRRKMRAARNAEREARRQRAREEGGNPDEEVSADEEDSEIDYEIEPERLTPESSPEPGQEFVDQRGYDQEQPEIQYDEDGNPIYPDDYDGELDENGDPIVYGDQEAVDEDGNLLENGGDDVAGGEAYADQADADAADEAAPDDDGYDLSRFDFRRTNDYAGRRGGEHDGDEDDDDEDDIDIEHHDHDEAYNAYDAVAQLEERRRRRLDYNPDEVIEEDQEGVMINNASHGKRRPRERWTKEETEFFYAVLSETGENYGLMAHYFPRRTIDQVKRKALKENKANPHRVTKAILNRKRLDPEYLRATVGYNAEKSPERVEAFMAEVTDDFDRVKKSASEMVVDGVNGGQGAEQGHEGGEGAEFVGEGVEEGEGADYDEYEHGGEEYDQGEYEQGAEGEYEDQEGEDEGEYADDAEAEAA